MLRVVRILGSCLLLAALAACAASTPPAPPASPASQETAAPQPQEVAKPAVPSQEATPTELVYIESVPMTLANAQALYDMVKTWPENPVFMAKGFDVEPYKTWLHNLDAHTSCKPGPKCPAEDKEYLRRLSILTLFYRSEMPGMETLIQDMEMQIEEMLKLWGRNPEFTIPEGAQQ